MSRWKSVGAKDPEPKLTGLVGYEFSNDSFVCATFNSPEGLVRIRKSDYGIVLEREVVEMHKRFKVSWSEAKEGSQVYTKHFSAMTEEQDARNLYQALQDTAKYEHVDLQEYEVPANSDGLVKGLAKLVTEGLPF